MSPEDAFVFQSILRVRKITAVLDAGELVGTSVRVAAPARAYGRASTARRWATARGRRLEDRSLLACHPDKRTDRGVQECPLGLEGGTATGRRPRLGSLPPRTSVKSDITGSTRGEQDIGQAHTNCTCNVNYLTVRKIDRPSVDLSEKTTPIFDVPKQKDKSPPSRCGSAGRPPSIRTTTARGQSPPSFIDDSIGDCSRTFAVRIRPTPRWLGGVSTAHSVFSHHKGMGDTYGNKAFSVCYRADG